MDPSYQFIQVETRDGIATITLNKPDILNAQDRFSLGELREALLSADDDDSVGVVILRGAGRAFCAGKNLKTSFGAAGFQRKEGEGAEFRDVCTTMESMKKPVIAAVQGHAVTGGALLAYTADIVIAAENAQFVDTHARWGLLPGAGESQRLPRIVGLAKAREMFLTCEPVDAQEAFRCGLVSRVVPLARLDEEARLLAEKVLKNSRESLRVLKQLLSSGARESFSAGLQQEAELVRDGVANWEPNADRDARLADFSKRPA